MLSFYHRINWPSNKICMIFMLCYCLIIKKERKMLDDMITSDIDSYSKRCLVHSAIVIKSAGLFISIYC